MNIIFLGSSGVFHPLMAGSIYLDILDIYDLPELAHYGDRELDREGYPIFLGSDELGNNIYSLGTGLEIDMTKKTIEQLAAILGAGQQDIRIKIIKIKWERLFIFLNLFTRLWPLNYVIAPLIDYLMQQELSAIKAETEAFRKQILDDDPLLSCQDRAFG